MIFSELYSAYYNTVAEILGEAVKGRLTEKGMQEIVHRNAFSESTLTVIPALKNKRWQLLNADLTTPVAHTPTMPLTLLQKRWLKSLMLDKRVKLFGIEISGLENIVPLFTQEDYCVYDKYSDGDDFEDPEYIKRFRMILDAVNTERHLKITMINRRGNTVRACLMPKKLEFSEKDDKFRLIGEGNRQISIINLGRIVECDYCDASVGFSTPSPRTRTSTVTMTLTDERNALERVMLHFAHFEKQALRLDKTHYRLTVKYDPDDESELIIRILSFGPMVKVDSPQRFVELIKDRLTKQMLLGLK